MRATVPNSPATIRPPTGLRLAILLGVAVLIAPGCVRQVTIVSDPPAASTNKGRVSLGPTPVEAEVWWLPLARQPVRVGMSGYRGEEILVGRNLGLFRRHTHHEVILIRSHSGSGTWTPDEAGQN